MGIIDHHDRAILLRKIAERGQRPDVAIHGEDTVDDQQLLSRLIFHRSELFFGMSGVFVAEDQDLRPRESRAIDNRGMVQLVGDDEVFLSQNR